MKLLIFKHQVRKKIKEPLRKMLVFFLAFSVIFSQTMVFFPSPVNAAGPWTQTDWSSEIGASTTNQYSSGSNIDATTTAGQVVLSQSSEKLSNTGFETDLTGWTYAGANNMYDAVPSITAAYGMRRLRTAYTGSLLRIRRSSDNTEQDIGYTATGDLDTSAISTFIGGGSGYIVNWYDQSGNGYTASQSTTANQPLYVASGQNGRPVITRQSVATRMETALSAATSTYTVLGVTKTIDAALSYYMFLGDTVNYNSYFGRYYQTNELQIALKGISARYATTDVTAWNVVSGVANGSTLTPYYNGNVLTAIAAATFGDGTFRLFNSFENNKSGHLVAEIIICNAALSTGDRQAAEAISNAYWAVYSVTAPVRDTTTTYASSAGSAKIVTPAAAYNYTQSVNVGDTNTYNLSAYAYTDGTAVTSSDVELFYNGSTISTTYTAAGSGWYQLTGTVTGVASSVGAGVQVKASKTVYVDNVSLNNYASSGTLTSNIFDTAQLSEWGTLSYSATTPTNTTATVKARTSNSSIMTGATAFASCIAISSGADISANSCVTDGHRYIQYEVTLTTTETSATPTFQDISLALSTYDSDAPNISLTALSPDPTTDNTPTLSGTATDSFGTVSNIQFQMDATSGSWSSCTADDGSFDEATETFTCNTSTALSDGSHTIYVRSTDSNNNTTSNANASTDTFTIDTTDPASFDLDSPSDKAYTSESKPTFRWKKTTDSGSGLSKYQVVVDGETIIDDINPEDPGSSANHVREDSNKYVKYDGNYIEARTKQDSKELDNGTKKWEVKAVDNVGNTRSSGTRTLYVDLDSPTIQLDSIADLNALTLKTTSNTGNAYTTTDQTPTFKGVADTDSTITVTFNSDSICETTANDDSSWKCIPDTSIPFGRYEVTITAKSKAGKTSILPMFYLFVSSGSLNTTLLETTTTRKETETVVPTKETSCKTYMVKLGDSLYGIAFSELGDGDKYKDLIELNKNEYPSLENNPQDISVGWKLNLPSCTEKDQAVEKTDTTEVQSTETYDVKVKVVDTNKQAVKGAKVTLFSTPRETTTDENGLAVFNDVEKGDHKVVIDYKGQVGEQPVTLDGEVEEFSFTVQIESKSPFTNPWVIGVIGLLILLLIIQAIWTFTKRRKLYLE